MSVDGGVVLTAKLAARLLADLLEAYRNSATVEDADVAVSISWGFASAAEMSQCIGSHANASYRCVNSGSPVKRRCQHPAAGR